jgi:hypothetical protein
VDAVLAGVNDDDDTHIVERQRYQDDTIPFARLVVIEGSLSPWDCEKPTRPIGGIEYRNMSVHNGYVSVFFEYPDE